MSIFVFGFKLPQEQKAAPAFSLSSKFIEKFSASADELFVLTSDYTIEIFAISDKREELVSQFMDTIQHEWHLPQENFKKDFFQKVGSEAVSHFFKRVIGVGQPADINESLREFCDVFELARERSLTGPFLDRLYQKGIWLSEKVRIELSLQENGTTTESVVTELAQKIFGKLDDHSALIAASSAECEKFVEKLNEKNIGHLYFLELDRKGIEGVCEKFRGHSITIEQMGQVLQSIDLILVFDSGFEKLLPAGKVSRIMNQRNNAPLFWATLSFAHEQQSKLSNHYNVYYYDRADLENIVASNLKKQQKSQRTVEKLLENEVESFIKWVHSEELFRFGNIIGRSRAMQRILDLVAQIAQTDISVLIDGESGTGKELVAMAIHEHSRRAKNPFIVVNCGAMAESLLESELFGHVRGAFTGATSNKKGLFEVANHGTIFLDEIGETSQAMQVKLLRFFQEGEVKPVGSNKTLTVDVRLITATNRNLEKLVQEGEFRQDLFYRLNVIQITIPPLRDRREDVLPLVEFFSKKYANKIQKPVKGVHDDVEQVLYQYHWPGNVRELENAIERAVALARGSQIGLTDLPPQIVATENRLAATEVDDKELSLQELEKNHIAKTLKQYNWEYERVTRILGIGRTTLWRKMKAYNISNSLPRAAKHLD
ncbi:sigma 54-interacting transcriptional regulator [candidate division KSB1 bacterium]|nr:sigma 54-interacting transcriptional regulator [candidate division KSB1 bacterium]